MRLNTKAIPWRPKIKACKRPARSVARAAAVGVLLGTATLVAAPAAAEDPVGVPATDMGTPVAPAATPFLWVSWESASWNAWTYAGDLWMMHINTPEWSREVAEVLMQVPASPDGRVTQQFCKAAHLLANGDWGQASEPLLQAMAEYPSPYREPDPNVAVSDTCPPLPSESAPVRVVNGLG